MADNGYFNAANVEACQAAGIDPLIALGRDAHHPRLAERFAAAPEDPTPVGAMAHRLRTPQGRALYALRHQTPEPVSGTINSVLGFRHFLLRGLDALWRRNWFPGVAAPRSVRTNEPSADLNQEPGPTG